MSESTPRLAEGVTGPADDQELGRREGSGFPNTDQRCRCGLELSDTGRYCTGGHLQPVVRFGVDQSWTIWVCPECGHWAGSRYLGPNPTCKMKDGVHSPPRPVMEPVEVVPVSVLSVEREGRERAEARAKATHGEVIEALTLAQDNLGAIEDALRESGIPAEDRIQLALHRLGNVGPVMSARTVREEFERQESVALGVAADLRRLAAYGEDGAPVAVHRPELLGLAARLEGKE